MPQINSNKTNTWSAAQYTKFEKERNRPTLDLLPHIPTKEVKTAVDIGCGPGNSTQLLQAHYPHATISGMDSSEDMVKAAAQRLPDIHFDVADISQWKGNAPYDVILANASLQWVPDHKMLFPSLINKLRIGGTLAVQMPDNFEEPTHKLMRAIASEGPWATKLSKASKRIAREGAGWYYEHLRDKVSTLDIWRTTYFHPLSGGAEAIVEWVRGTGLRPFLDPLDKEEQAAFLGTYTDEIATAYPIYADGTVLLPFPRLFIIATR